ncbi:MULTISPECIES: hypothetical protein [Pseudomonas]|jgi:hypothetical protein|uniref:Uncharacterized protein n=1 Tax=Pseudomonas putida TaxID=303 RepID=A0AAW6PPM1_PSEPU|nr:MULTISPECIES: hypothetical protein [Pseudomonas]CAI3809600.1 hypothetical protein DBADOPDK_05648 [Pseudomonas sp. MM223]CAI3809993.1 hypothetical protein GLGCALEP_05787 [Pseudomonas sp. MM221]ASM87287.1 hypothetical protein BWR11_23725 [Pseudomonas aeruginosa]EKT4542400.1 hypothetical protein [Pseudomonas putida]EKT4567906.1 hypothetical protein [Pseudomonas putida]
MTMSEAVSTGALVLIGVILTVLLMQYLRLREIWHVALACRQDARWARIWEMENRELRSALRAEKAHIEQLQSKLVILQNLISAER